MSDVGADSPLESRVEDLFSDAVERQVAERRATGRALEELSGLVASLDQRLARIEQSTTRANATPPIDVDGLVAQLAQLLQSPVQALGQQLDDRLTRLEAADAARTHDVRDQVESLAEQLSSATARFRESIFEVVEGIEQRQAQGHESLTRAVLSATEPAPVLDIADIADAVVVRMTDAAPPPIDLDAVADAVVVRMTEAAPPPLDVGVIAEAVVGRIAAQAPPPDDREQVLRDGIEQIRAELEEGLAAMAPLPARLSAGLADLTTAVGGVRLDIARSEEDRDELRRQITVVLDSLSEDLSAAAKDRDRQADVISQRAAVTFDARGVKLVDEMQNLVGEFATELGEAMAGIAERAEAAQDANAENIDLMGATVSSFDKHLRAIRENLKKSAAEMASQSTAMEAMIGDVTGMGETLGRVVGEMQAQLAADQEVAVHQLRDVLTSGERRLELAGDSMVAQTDHALQQLADATEIVRTSADGLREQLEIALDDLASVARVEAEEARDEVVAAGARLDLLFDRLAGFERAIIDHLAARDATFSRERALIVEDLVDQLSGGLGKRERKRLAARLELPEPSQPAATERAKVPSPRTPAPGTRDVELEDPLVTPGRRSKATAAAGRVTRADLLAIDGLGPAKLDALLAAFGSPAKVARASAEELAQVSGISERLAKDVRRALS